MGVDFRNAIFHYRLDFTNMLTRSPMPRVKTIGVPKPPRFRKCAVKGCLNRFTPRSIAHKACGPDCAASIAYIATEKQKRQAEKTQRIKDTHRRESLKSLSDWIRDVQIVFNRAIRLRDQLAGYPCISSGRPLDWNGNAVDAGHYRSRGSAPHLRFVEDNCHAQSKKDNRYGAGNITDYRVNLIVRIGIERVEALECNNTPRKYTIDELRILKSYYQILVNERKKELRSHHD